MEGFNFKRWKLILSWTAFSIALVVYYMTVEPTVGFWDTGEYILTSSKLEVGHPPGAPLFQMLGAFFSIFASDVIHNSEKSTPLVNLVNFSFK